ncbi:MBL fold hydrolase [Haematobacter massiliensis]|mgnify:CR=1 FL=1|uniref:Metallo-beta-lactamase n=1 Tax=Haematobacter massiliensis TaxID=195105 RepID=A0A086XW31_9RHOB|nr:MBL fold metallo-hydrolase [Haematobacter massiliensis]KFI26231.1 metallo-beta-lactamase [Haematobacter massiliensis]OWJ70106.1 MBL fold hydrolase [Haematobacter massiliensis]OWJ86720.1 MBL fold hydrolase [Haematobacter massiliensis]QBJ24650.1 MBL fold metallo-hydrolase [Haematobacter massiliensis]
MDDFNPTAGAPETLAVGLRRIVAPNPSAMTYRGTNTYLLGEGRVTLVDPGPDDDRHLSAILEALRPGERIERILVTHSHVDHSALAARLAGEVGAPVTAFGDSAAGRSGLMEGLVAAGMSDGGEGADSTFAPDEELADGAEILVGGQPLRALHTPGHFGNHLSFLWGGFVLSGDQVMGWATSIVSPPDGDMGAYMASLDRLMPQAEAVFLPGHGAPITDAAARIGSLRDHRRMRERQIRAALEAGGGTARSIAAAIYTDTPAPLIPAAERNVLAHLIDLAERGVARTDGTIRPDTTFHLSGK